jgi:predicted small lipoprotein YifL
MKRTIFSLVVCAALAHVAGCASLGGASLSDLSAQRR